MDESTISESAESEIRKKKKKAAEPLAGQGLAKQTFFWLVTQSSSPLGTRDETREQVWRLGLAALQAACQR